EVAAAAHAVLARLRGVGGDYRAWFRHGELAVEAGAALEPNGMFPSPFGELGFAKLLTGQGFNEQLFERGIELESKLVRVREPYQSPEMGLAFGLLYTGELSRARAVMVHQRDLALEFERVHSAAGCVLHLVEL